MTKSLAASRLKTPAKAAKFTPDWDVYASVSRAANLLDVKLVSSSYAVRPEVLPGDENIEKMDLRYGGECVDYSFETDEGMAFGTFRWTAEVKRGRKSCLKVRSDYFLAYDGLADQDAEHVEFFFIKVGRFASYPYFRSHFSHHLSETGIMFPPLPILHERVD